MPVTAMAMAEPWSKCFSARFMEPRQAPGKPEGNQKHGFANTSHSPWVSLRAEQDAHEVAQIRGTQGKLSWVPLWWLSIAPGRFLRVSGQSLHLPSTNWGLQTVSSTDNTKGTNSWITNALFFWLHLETSSQKRKKWARILFLLPHLQTAMLVLCGVQEQEDKLAAPCPGWHPKSD